MSDKVFTRFRIRVPLRSGPALELSKAVACTLITPKQYDRIVQYFTTHAVDYWLQDPTAECSVDGNNRTIHVSYVDPDRNTHHLRISPAGLLTHL